MNEVFDIEVLHITNPESTETGVPRNIVIPTFTSQYSTKEPWILYGEDNRFPFFLIDIAKKSYIHGSILESKKNIIAGELVFAGDNESEVNTAKEFFDSIGLTSKLHKSICADMALFGGSFMQLVFGSDASANFGIRRLVKSRFETVRLGVREPDDDGIPEINTHYIHADWDSPPKKGKNAPKDVPVFDIEPEEEVDKSEKLQSFLIGNDSSLMDAYPKPDYLSEGALDAIMLDAEIIKFDVNDLKNGMNAGYIVTFIREDYSKADPEKERKLREDEKKMVKDHLQGSGNASRVVITRAKPSDKDRKPIEITPIPNVNVADRHRVMREEKTIAILASHGMVAPELAGIPGLSSSGFGDKADFLVTAHELLIENRIKDLQQPIKDFYNGLIEKFLKDVEVKIDIVSRVPITPSISDEMWQKNFTKDEFRTSRKYPVLTDEQNTEIAETESAQKSFVP